MFFQGIHQSVYAVSNTASVFCDSVLTEHPIIIIIITNCNSIFTQWQ